MKAAKTTPFPFLIVLLVMASCRTASVHSSENGMIVRISEIEIHRDSLPAYKAILKEEAAASVRLEPGVISIFPMYQQNDSTQIRILEIYASKKAYQSHIKAPHFQHYKTATLSMVKSLQLIDMNAINPETMTTENNTSIFPQGEQGSKDYFTGTTYVTPLLPRDSNKYEKIFFRNDGSDFTFVSCNSTNY